MLSLCAAAALFGLTWGSSGLAQRQTMHQQTWLDEQQSTKARFSAQTRNFYRDTLMYFLNWCVERVSLPGSPAASTCRE